MASAAPALQPEQIIFDSSVDGLVRAVKKDLTPTTKNRLRTMGLDVDAKLLPGYPAKQWASFVCCLAEDIFPGQERTEAHRKLAHRTVDAFSQSVIGSAMFAVCRLVGPDRTIGRMTKNLRTGSNYVETKSTQVGPHAYEIWINDVTGVPGFYLGIIERGLLHVGAKGVAIAIGKTEEPACTLNVSWKDE